MAQGYITADDLSSTPRSPGLRTSKASQKADEARRALSAAGDKLQEVIDGLRQAAGEGTLPEVFPSVEFRLSWLVDLNGSWRGVESMLHVGAAGLRLTQVVLATPDEGGKIGGVKYKEIGSWDYTGVLEWGASDTHLLLACRAPAATKGKDYILETKQAPEIVALIKQHVVVAVVAKLPDEQLRDRLVLMAQELDQMKTMRLEMGQIKSALAKLHSESARLQRVNDDRREQIEVEQERRRELAQALTQLEVAQSAGAALVPGMRTAVDVGVTAGDLTAGVDRRLAYLGVNYGDNQQILLSALTSGKLNESVEPQSSPGGPHSAAVIESLLVEARALQASHDPADASAAAALIKRVDKMQGACSPSAIGGRRASIDERRASVSSMDGFAYRRQSIDGGRFATSTSGNGRRPSLSDTTSGSESPAARRGSFSAMEVVGR